MGGAERALGSVVGSKVGAVGEGRLCRATETTVMTLALPRVRWGPLEGSER